MELPDYDQLPIAPDKPPHSAWGVWGDEDELGSINLLDESCVKRGIATVKAGKVFPLNWTLEKPNPPFYGREPMRHRIYPITDFAMDDAYDNFFPQGSSQWDALCHVAHPDYGYYNGRAQEEFTGVTGTKNGIEHWAKKGIVGRGILLDVPRYLSSVGRPLDPGTRVDFSVEDLEETRRFYNIECQMGDILLVRTGWMEWYEALDQEARDALAEDSFTRLTSPGLAAGADMARYLWDNHFAAVASDSSALEAWPHRFIDGEYLHFALLPLLGMAIGELWFLEDLASDCLEDGRYEFLLTSAPLNKLGGVGSPPNAIAIK